MAAGDHTHRQRLRRLAAKREAEDRGKDDWKHEDPEHRLRLANQLADACVRQLHQRSANGVAP